MHTRFLLPVAALLMVTAGQASPLLGIAPALDPSGPRHLTVLDGHAAWSVDLGLSLAAGKGVTTPAAKAKSVCALGDVDHDGHDDILVKVSPGKTDGYKFEALAGPDFTRSLWLATPRDAKVLTCGADTTGDGVQDPIVVTPPAPQPPAGSPTTIPDTAVTTTDAGTTTSTPIDGASGTTLAEIDVSAGSDTIDTPAASAGTVQSGAVVPAGDGALLIIDNTDAAADSGILAGASAAEGPATIVVADEQGVTQGTIETPAGSDALAAAPLPNDQGLPDVVVLAETVVSPIEGLPASVPSVTLNEGDGTVVWTADQEATSGVPVLLPVAGDVDGDGTQDMIYATVPAETATLPAAGFEVISGRDGSTIVGSGPAQDGLLTALPLDDVTGDGASEVLVIEQPVADQPIQVSAQDRTGEAVWTEDIAPDATPINTVTEPGTGNTIGFSDLTGDGVADVAVATPTGDGILVEVIDGATGDVSWSGQFDGADSVTAVESDAAGGGADLVVVDTDGGLSVIGVDGATGETTWQAEGEGTTSQASDVVAVGDVDGDGVDDILVTVGEEGTDGGVDPDRPGSAHIISGKSGEPIWSAASDGGDSGIVLQGGPGASDPSQADAGPALWPVLVVGAAVVLLVGFLMVRKRGVA